MADEGNLAAVVGCAQGLDIAAARDDCNSSRERERERERGGVYVSMWSMCV